MPLLDVQQLTVRYPTETGFVRAVSQLSLQIQPGEIHALAGETGSGKSTVALALIGLLDPRTHFECGRVLFDGRDLALLPEASWRNVRGREISIVFQEPRSALNPVLTVEAHLVETIRAHRDMSARAALERAEEVLGEVGVPDPGYYMRRYPHELSGGLCQRIAIALGICNHPRLLIADEPTSALDPTLQAQILSLLRDLNRSRGLTILLITHDLILAADFAATLSVMYNGRLVESGPAGAVIATPAHPYTHGLVASVPGASRLLSGERLAAIPGQAPPAGEEHAVCPFAPRCRWAVSGCSDGFPEPRETGENRWAACLRPRPWENGTPPQGS